MKIRNAASIVLVDRRGKKPRILMGRRAAKHKFMPNVYVFPGGRVDYKDRFTPYAADYHSDTLELLMQQMQRSASAVKARMIGLAAIRETQEEVGLLIGKKAETTRRSKGRSWEVFKNTGMLPDLSQIVFLARAITPPGNTRRFDTRFFIADVSDHLENQNAQSSDELEDICWVTLEEARELKIPFITNRILLAVDDALASADCGKKPIHIPFYRAKPNTHDVAKVLTFLRPGQPPLSYGEVETVR